MIASSVKVILLRYLCFKLYNSYLDCNTWVQHDGYYVDEVHGTASECYSTQEEAKTKCKTFLDCNAIATQNDVCGGQFRVTHGGLTFIYLEDWKSSNLSAWERNICSNVTEKGR